jgi:uncharacterized protein
VNTGTEKVTAHDRPLPTVSRDSQAYWFSTSAHAIRLQRCAGCHAFRFYPTPICGDCGGSEFIWERISGRGEVYSFTVVHRPATPAFDNGAPVVLVLVTLHEGPTMMAQLIECLPDAVQIGMQVGVDYLDMTEEITLPVFKPWL